MKLIPANCRKKIKMLWLMEQNFDQPVKNDFWENFNIRKIATGQGDDYTSGPLLDYPYFDKLIANGS